jgi:aminoglycoside phosphotransferase (APT) family kinase protein
MSPARLGFVDEEEVKLHDEANRWIRLFGTVEDELRSGADECACLILEDVPKSGRSAIVHGDYRLGNIIFSGSRPSAVIDWEIWAVGDPRTDLAWFLTICDPTRPQTIKGRLGMPPLDDLKRRYEETKGEATTDLAWFLALARFKNAATVAAIIKHNRQRAIPQTRAESLAPLIAPLLESVRRMLSERS